MTGHPFYEGLELLAETQLEYILRYFSIMLSFAVMMSSAFSGHGK